MLGPSDRKGGRQRRVGKIGERRRDVHEGRTVGEIGRSDREQQPPIPDPKSGQSAGTRIARYRRRERGVGPYSLEQGHPHLVDRREQPRRIARAAVVLDDLVGQEHLPLLRVPDEMVTEGRRGTENGVRP